MARVPIMTSGKILLAQGTHCCPKFVYIYPTSLSIISCTTCVCTHIWLPTDCLWITVATKYHSSEIFCHKSERCEVLTGYLSLGRRPGGDRANTWHWTERVTVFFWTGSSSSRSYCHILLLIAFLEEVFVRNMIIIVCVNYNMH